MPAQRAANDLMPGHRAQQLTQPIQLNSVERRGPQVQPKRPGGSCASARCVAAGPPSLRVHSPLLQVRSPVRDPVLKPLPPAGVRGALLVIRRGWLSAAIVEDANVGNAAGLRGRSGGHVKPPRATASESAESAYTHQPCLHVRQSSANTSTQKKSLPYLSQHGYGRDSG